MVKSISRNKLTKEKELFWSKLPIIPGHPKFRPNFLRQLFCKHRFDNFQHENGWASFLMCRKCGKFPKLYSSFSDSSQLHKSANTQKDQGVFVGLEFRENEKCNLSKEDNLCDFCGVLPKSNHSNYCNACKHENLS